MAHKFAFIKEIFLFLAKKKKYWLIPVVVVLLLFAVLFILSESSAIAPFIYTLF